MIFSEAFDRLRGGYRIRIKEWSPGNFLMSRKLVKGDTIVELYLDNATHRVTWSPTQREIMSNDWEVAPEPEPQMILPDGMEVFGRMGERD